MPSLSVECAVLHKIRSRGLCKLRCFLQRLRAMQSRRISVNSTLIHTGMIVDATEHMQTNARQTGSNASHRGSAAGAAAALSSPGNPGQLPGASNCSFCWRLGDVGRGCPATMVQQRLLLRCLRGLRCFRIAWQWSPCASRPQSFPRKS